jgi:hypothetical protein
MDLNSEDYSTESDNDASQSQTNANAFNSSVLTEILSKVRFSILIFSLSSSQDQITSDGKVLVKFSTLRGREYFLKADPSNFIGIYMLAKMHNQQVSRFKAILDRFGSIDTLLDSSDDDMFALLVACT